MRRNREVFNALSYLQRFFSHPLTRRFFQKIFFVKKELPPSRFYGESILYIFFLIWGFRSLGSTDFANDPYGVSDSFFHNFHFVFHEAGHLIFGFLGEFIAVFGGTLMQLLIPLIIMIQFLRQKDNFSASIGFWLLGHSLLDIAPYIYDAWDMKLILLGGGTGHELGSHDWRYLLTALNLLENYKGVAGFVAFLGQLVLWLSFIWGGIVLYKKYLFLKRRNFSS